MSASPHAQSEANGSLSQENAPEVIVRAGKYFVCSSCGVMVEIPEDVVGQLVLAVAPSSEEKTEEPPAPSETARRAPTTQHSESTATNSPRPKRPKRPERVSFVGQTIDGLRVPSADELDRAFSWVTFHLTVLDRQGSEIKRLKKLLKRKPTAAVPCPRPRVHAEEDIEQTNVCPAREPQQCYPHKDVGVACDADDIQQRGPP